MTVIAPRPSRRVSARELGALLTGWDGEAGPAYRLLADRLRLLVLDGRLPVHAVLPSERALADATGTSRTTTTAAYRLLREAGFAAAGHGSGTWTALPTADGAHEGTSGRAADDSVGVPFPVTVSGEASPSDGRGDFSSAAPEAPAQVYAAYSAALTELPRYLPGHGYVTAGLPALRERIAARYTDRGLATTPDQVLVTSGAMHGLRLVLAALVSPGDRVLCENPTYPLAVDAVRRAGGRPVALDVEQGWDADRLESTLRRTSASLAYLMPDFQNPTGRLMDDTTRERTAAVLGRRGCTVLVDETTVDLDLRGPDWRGPDLRGPGSRGPDPREPGRRLPRRRPLPFAAFAPGAVCLGSASKTFWGGLRVGWIRADAALVRRLTVQRAGDDLGSPVLEQLATAHLLDDVDAVLAERLTTLRSRRDALTTALGAWLPDWTVPPPDGGMVAWCRLPRPRSTALAAAARALGVMVTAGPRFAVGSPVETGAMFEDRIRLPFARPEPQLVAAARLLATAWRGDPVPSEHPPESVVL